MSSTRNKLTGISIDELPSTLEDTRDTTAFPDAEAKDQLRFEEFLAWAPKPDVRMISFYFYSWMLLTLAHSTFGLKPKLR